MRGLLQADEFVPLLLELPEHGGQRAVHLQDHALGTVARDLIQNLRRAAGDDASDSTTPGSAHDVREIDIAAQGGACQNKLARLQQFLRWLVPEMFETV